MDILYSSQRVEILFNNFGSLRKKYGEARAQKIMLRQQQLSVSEHLFEFSNLPPSPRCHELKKKGKKDRTGTFGISLDGSWRLIIEPCDDPLPLDGNGKLLWNRICAVRILGAEDYHD